MSSPGPRGSLKVSSKERYARAGLQDHCGSRERPRERAHPGLIDARDRIMPLVPEKRFIAEHLAKPLSFGPVFKTPLFNHGQDSARSRAAVSAQDFFEARLKRPTLDDMALT
ncbi:hypothetical protein [Bradyrhizobium sp. MOS001]|uniref:hypothetical protein n=1 Tax=Bradyrhizobium sp. MOS001 TaxID=2133948 RepID=UPI0014300785